MLKKIVRLSYPILVFGLLFFISCDGSKRIRKDVAYFNEGLDTISVISAETVIQPNDLLSITVYSRTLNQEQATIFNIPAGAENELRGYLVNNKGEISMPVIGPVKVEGLTKEQLQLSLEKQLTNYVKNPSVLIRFLRFYVNVMGEVRSPGTQKFSSERVTVIDALSAAGDLTDFGRRDSIAVIREKDGKRIYHYVDLRKRNVFESPVYILQPNDIVYVSPDKQKLKNLSVDPEKQRRTGFFLSVISILISIASLIIFSLD